MESPTKRPKYSVALNGPDVAVASADEEPIDPAWLLTHMEELDVLKQLHERSMQSRPLPRALASLAEVKKTTLNDDIKVVGSLSEGFQLVRATRVDCPTPVSGLAMVEEFITSDEERSLMQLIDSSAWSRTLSRRTQQYGFEYNYSQLNVRPAPTAPIPDLFLPIMQRLVDRGLFPRLPDQLIINEYEPGQGIAAHTDHEKFFGEPICSISMGSACVMDFTHKGKRSSSASNEGRSHAQLLPRRSAVIMTGDARHRWQHSIAKRKTDRIGNKTIHRQRRVSLTFRLMIPAPTPAVAAARAAPVAP